MTPTRIAVIGAGLIGRKHLAILRDDPAFEVAGIADPSPQAGAYARENGAAIVEGYPFDTALYSLVTVPAVHSHWILNYVLHWTFVAELLLVAAAAVSMWRGRREAPHPQ